MNIKFYTKVFGAIAAAFLLSTTSTLLLVAKSPLRI